ncbi:MAG: ADP-ribosylation factor-like protein [Pseudomonadota bacterium]
MSLRPKKILMIGAPAVGKTSVTRRLKFGTFDVDYKSTIGVQLHEIPVSTSQGELAMLVWDTDGNFGEQVFDTVYAKGATGAIVVGDVSRPDTVEHMVRLADDFAVHFPARPSLCLVNKTDLFEPSAQSLEDLRGRVDMLAACSALSGAGLDAAFTAFAETVVARSQL